MYRIKYEWVGDWHKLEISNDGSLFDIIDGGQRYVLQRLAEFAYNHGNNAELNIDENLSNEAKAARMAIVIGLRAKSLEDKIGQR